jgi:hypothetical protein
MIYIYIHGTIYITSWWGPQPANMTHFSRCFFKLGIPWPIEMTHVTFGVPNVQKPSREQCSNPFCHCFFNLLVGHRISNRIYTNPQESRSYNPLITTNLPVFLSLLKTGMLKSCFSPRPDSSLAPERLLLDVHVVLPAARVVHIDTLVWKSYRWYIYIYVFLIKIKMVGSCFFLCRYIRTNSDIFCRRSFCFWRPLPVYINQKLILKTYQLVLSTFFSELNSLNFFSFHDLIISNPNVSRMKSCELCMFHHFCPITSSDIDFFPYISPWFPPEIHTVPYVFPWSSPLLPVANPSPPAPQQPLREVEDVARELHTRCVAGALTEGAAGGTSRPLRDLQNYRCKISSGKLR